MKIQYYYKESVRALFRYSSEESTQERWDTKTSAWVNVAPSLYERIYNNEIGTDAIDEKKARKLTPEAFA
jgi:hypothetical protein